MDAPAQPETALAGGVPLSCIFSLPSSNGGPIYQQHQYYTVVAV